MQIYVKICERFMYSNSSNIHNVVVPKNDHNYYNVQHWIKKKTRKSQSLDEQWEVKFI